MSEGQSQRGDIDGIIPKIIDEFAFVDETCPVAAGVNNDAAVKAFGPFLVGQKL